MGKVVIGTERSDEAVRAQQARAVGAYSNAVELATQRYVEGSAQYFEVLDAQTQLSRPKPLWLKLD